MAITNEGVLALFATLDPEQSVRTDAYPKLDLELYPQNYTGRIRYDRLLCVALTSTLLCVDALRSAILEAKKGIDVERYRKAVGYLQIADPDSPEAILDQAWVDFTETANLGKVKKLEGELKSYKNSLVKDSIRMGNEDLGKQFENSGRLAEAAEVYNRMRPDIVTGKQGLDLFRYLARVALQRKQWSVVLAYTGIARGVPTAEDKKAAFLHQQVLRGIADLGQERYPEAAACFLKVHTTEGISSYSDFASPSDVASYGAILALATMNRSELQKQVLESADFRPLLELEAYLRRAVQAFVNGRYANCLSILEAHKPDFLLDIYLQKHVDYLFRQIRRKCITQYLIPFSCVTLDSLDEAFAKPGESIEKELVELIRSKALNARIDAINRVLNIVHIDARAQMQAAALEATEQYEKETLSRARRMAILSAGLEVKSTKAQNKMLSTAV